MGLFRPAWQDKDEEKACEAVGKIKNQTKLLRIAREVTSSISVREVAIKKLTDQATLADLARDDKVWEIRVAAVEVLTDQSMLADLTNKKGDNYVRQKAVVKLTDQVVLTHIAKNDEDRFVRSAAVDKLTDQTLLAHIAKNDDDSLVRCAAAVGLIDQDVLAHIAKDDENSAVRLVATYKLTDQTLLADIAKHDEDEKVRRAAIEKLPAELAHEIQQLQQEDVSKKLDSRPAEPLKRIYSEAEVESLTDELIRIGKTDGFLSLQSGGEYNEKKRHIRACEIGTRLNEMGGIELMQRVGNKVARSFPAGSPAGRELEAAWAGIGEWM